MEKISIIIPVYNVEEYLEKCICSVIAQTYKNTEIILVDDGSPDRCGEICDEYAEKDNRIRVIHKKNGGLSDARNVGIENASGEYIMFIDSDDYIHPEMIQKLYAALIEESADMCICGMKWVNGDGSPYTDVLPCPVENCVLTRDNMFDVFNIPEYFYFVTAVNKLYKKMLFDEVKFPFGKRNEDEFVAHRIFDKCGKIVCIKDCLYCYVQRGDSIMHTDFGLNHFDSVDAALDRSEFFKQKKMRLHEKHAARKAYGLLYSLLGKLDVFTHGKICALYSVKVIKALGFDLRGIKVVLKYAKGLAKHVFFRAKLVRSGLLSNGARCVIVATPVHGNLGDQAIVFAERKMLKRLYPERKILEISNSEYLCFSDLCRKYIKPEDLIIIDGGGNLGSLWPNEDKKISGIISNFPKNKIRIFPQTCYYDTEKDRELAERNAAAYKSAEDLGVMLRDKKSFEVFSDLYKDVKTMLVPDIVFSLQPTSKAKRSGKVLLCFRDDCEKCMNEEDNIKITEFLKSSGIPFFRTSTLVGHNVTQKTRADVLQKKWDEFSSADLVITDRLHAMIFSAITATPCIALDNVSKKVSGAYEWIKDLDYVCLCGKTGEVTDKIPVMMKIDKCEYDFQYPVTQIEEFLK